MLVFLVLVLLGLHLEGLIRVVDPRAGPEINKRGNKTTPLGHLASR